MIEYQTYFARDVRAWLYEGIKNGLNESVITKIRANALLYNPYVNDDTLLVVTATDGERLVGYTAMFPDKLVNPSITLSVATTLWVDPDYAGDFVSLYMTKILMENPIGNLIGTDAAPASIMVDKLLGLKAEMYIKKRYVLNRKIKVRSLRNFCSLILEPCRQFQRYINVKRMLNNIPADWRVEYTNFIDNEAYRFILDHNENDIMTRSQDMLNWIVRNPFRVEAPISKQCLIQNCFSAYNCHFLIRLVKCYQDNKMVGLYMFAERGDNTVVLLLYYEKDKKRQVYTSLLQHVFMNNPSQLWSQYPDLNNYIDKSGISFRGYEVKFSFTHPIEFHIDDKKQLQGLDGDMFA